LSKILSEQAPSDSRGDIQRAYDRLRQILAAKSDSFVDRSLKSGKAQPSREDDKKQVSMLRFL
jgi:hypothetical protein